MSRDEHEAPKRLAASTLIGLLTFGLGLFSVVYWAVTDFLGADWRNPVVFGFALAFFMLPLHDVLKKRVLEPPQDKKPPDAS